MIIDNELNVEKLRRIITKLPPGRARSKYETALGELLGKGENKLNGVKTMENLERDVEVVIRRPQRDEDGINSILAENDPVMEIIRGWGNLVLKEWIETREEKKLLAAKVYCEIFEEDIWLIFDESFLPNDELTYYSTNQILVLKGHSHDKLRKHYVIIGKLQDELRKIQQSY